MNDHSKTSSSVDDEEDILFPYDKVNKHVFTFIISSLNEASGVENDATVGHDSNKISDDSVAISSPNCSVAYNDEVHVADPSPSIRVQNNHPQSNTIGNMNSKVTTRKKDKVYFAKNIMNSLPLLNQLMCLKP